MAADHERPAADRHPAAVDLTAHALPRRLDDIPGGGRRDAPLDRLIDQRAGQEMA